MTEEKFTEAYRDNLPFSFFTAKKETFDKDSLAIPAEEWFFIGTEVKETKFGSMELSHYRSESGFHFYVENDTLIPLLVRGRSKGREVRMRLIETNVTQIKKGEEEEGKTPGLPFHWIAIGVGIVIAVIMGAVYLKRRGVGEEEISGTKVSEKGGETTYCPSCGSGVSPAAKFCPECGEELSQRFSEETKSTS